ncbi:hypothetical protein HOI83_00810 [Candidatus Uhrbacteria bacterium]|jgi:hypothetical protein|nr:hypothetical protein [Candidatus Uhrbacteria bacterium]
MSMDILYHAFSAEEADKKWEEFESDYKRIKASGYDGCNTPADDAIFNLIDYVSKKNTREIGHAFTTIDVAYGSVSSEMLEDGKIEYDIVDDLAMASEQPLVEGIPTGEFLVTLFTTLSKEIIKKVVNSFMQRYGWELKEARDIILRYLEYVRPVALRLKEDPNSVFVSEYNGSYGGDGEELINVRSVAYQKKFSEFLKTV